MTENNGPPLYKKGNFQENNDPGLSKKGNGPALSKKTTGPHFPNQTKDNGPYHDTLIKFNHDSNYDGDEFISFWQVIIA
jgi:hypothetical protein